MPKSHDCKQAITKSREIVRVFSKFHGKDSLFKWSFDCVFRSGAHPDVFKLCRRDKSSVNRHITHRHGGKSNIVDVKPYYSAGETIKKARKYIENLEKDSDSDQDKHAEKKLNNPAGMSQASQPSPVARTQSTLISKTGISSPPASQHLIQSTLNISAKSVDDMSTTTLSQGQGFKGYF